MTYQDRWIHGGAGSKGYRECARRYDLVKGICQQYNDKFFSVCDIGANLCYFGLRLTEEFPRCFVTAFEFNPVVLKQAAPLVKDSTRLHLINRKLTLAGARALAGGNHFNLVLAMSVLHHCTGPSRDWIEALCALGDNVVIEYAQEDSTRVARIPDIPNDAKVLGYGDSHLNAEIRRPIILLQNKGVSRNA